MDFEFLLRKRPEWRAIAQGVLFRSGDITDERRRGRGGRGAGGDGGGDAPASDGSLGIGDLEDAS